MPFNVIVAGQGQNVYWFVEFGVAYNAPVTLNGGTAGYDVSLSGGLPTGLSLFNNPILGYVIVGTPSELGVFAFELTVTDSLGNTTTQPFNWQTIPADGVFLSAGVPAAEFFHGVTVGTPAAFQFQITGTGSGPVPPYTFEQVPNEVGGQAYLNESAAPPVPNSYPGWQFDYQQTGAFPPAVEGLPAGLAVDGAGNVTGTPTDPYGALPHRTVNYGFVFRVTDAVGHATVFGQSGFIVNPPPLSVSCGSPPEGEVGVPYSYQLPIVGGVSPYTVLAFDLAPGLSIDDTGLISGTPTTAGSFLYAAEVIDSASQVAGPIFCSITISGGGGGSVSVSCNNPPVGLLLNLYGHTFVASGGEPPYTWALLSGSLPPGLVLDGLTGVVSGIPTDSGVFGFTLQVTDSDGETGTGSCSITVGVSLKNLEIILRGVKRAPAPSCETLESMPEECHVKRVV